jgi:hypothetical protein
VTPAVTAAAVFSRWEKLLMNKFKSRKIFQHALLRKTGVKNFTQRSRKSECKVCVSRKVRKAHNPIIDVERVWMGEQVNDHCMQKKGRSSNRAPFFKQIVAIIV